MLATVTLSAEEAGLDGPRKEEEAVITGVCVPAILCVVAGEPLAVDTLLEVGERVAVMALVAIIERVPELALDGLAIAV